MKLYETLSQDEIKLKIIRANIYNEDGLTIIKPKDMIIEACDLEVYRNTLKGHKSNVVLFVFKETV